MTRTWAHMGRAAVTGELDQRRALRPRPPASWLRPWPLPWRFPSFGNGYRNRPFDYAID
jgi:hypothetical protein